MNWFRRRRRTPAQLLASLQDVFPSEYELKADEYGVGIILRGNLLAYAELSRSRKDVVIGYSIAIMGGYAAEIALIVSSVIDTYVDLEIGFEATRFEDLRPANAEAS